MAGTLEITETLCWMPAGWVYDNVLRDLATSLQAANSPLSCLLLSSITEENGGYCDLRDCEGVQLRQLICAARTTYSSTAQKGPDAFGDPRFYAGYMEQFQQLIEMLEAKQTTF
jgi:hypothetical protein